MRPQTGSLALGIALLALPILTGTAAQAAPPQNARTCLHTPTREMMEANECLPGSIGR